jgi:hypothetical protein
MLPAAANQQRRKTRLEWSPARGPLLADLEALVGTEGLGSREIFSTEMPARILWRAPDGTSSQTPRPRFCPTTCVLGTPPSADGAELLRPSTAARRSSGRKRRG